MKPILIIQHAELEHPAGIGRTLFCEGIPTKELHPYRGEAYPDTSEIAGIVSLGGFMGANDESDHPWIKKEIDLLKRALDAGLPIAGLCLGGQLLARASGGEVTKNDLPEIGWHEVELTDEGKKDPILKAAWAGDHSRFYQWHYDTFFPSKKALFLAYSAACARQAYRIGERAYGFQFHPEADICLMQEWTSAEGSEAELERAKKEFTKTVQLKSEQESLAAASQIHGLKLCLALCLGLFEKQIKASPRRPKAAQGKTVKKIEILGVEFDLIQDDNGLLWPIRSTLV